MNLPEGTPEWAVTAVGTLVALGLVFKALGIVLKTDEAKRIGELVSWAVKRFDKQQLSDNNDQANAVRELNIALAAILRDSGANRINAIRLHNGGGPLDKDSEKFVTVEDSVTEGLSVDSRVTWHKHPVSKAYRKDVLAPILKDQNTAHFLHAMELKDQQLGTHYMAEEITTSLVQYAVIHKEDLWYASLNYKDLCPEGSDPMIRAAKAQQAIAAAANALRNLVPRIKP